MNAKEMIMKRSTIAKTFTIAAVTALALGMAPTAKADDKGCSKRHPEGHLRTHSQRIHYGPAPNGPARWPMSVRKPSTEMALLRPLES